MSQGGLHVCLRYLSSFFCDRVYNPLCAVRTCRRSTAAAATLAREGRIVVFAVGRGGPPPVLSVAEPLARARRSEERGCGAGREGEICLFLGSQLSYVIEALKQLSAAFREAIEGT